jgi:mycothiol maleylpyruvate isomerase-like protein
VTEIRTLFGTALVDIGGWLLGHQAALAERFDGPSALAEFSVRGLAGHLRRAMTVVETYLDQPAPAASSTTGPERLSAAGYYANVLPADGDLDSEFNRSIRQRGLESAPGRPDDFVVGWGETVGRVITRLEQEPDDRLVQVYGGLVLTLDEYLVTRLIELVVHADDLAASLDAEPALLSPAATGLVIATLVEVARIRHGDTAVVRALTRRERDASEALRVI